MLNNARLAEVKTRKRVELIGWNFPNEGWTKCNTDGACLDGGRNIGCDSVLRDDSGRWIIGFTRGIGEGSVLTAELWGIITSLEVA